MHTQLVRLVAKRIEELGQVKLKRVQLLHCRGRDIRALSQIVQAHERVVDEGHEVSQRRVVLQLLLTLQQINLNRIVHSANRTAMAFVKAVHTL